MSEYSVGELRGWLERYVAEKVADADVLLELDRIALLPSAGERAYCVSSLIRAGIVELRFFCLFKSSGLGKVGMYWSPPELAQKDSQNVFRPAVYVRRARRRCPRKFGSNRAVDVFADWPPLPYDQIPRPEKAHAQAHEAHIGAYFAYFASFGLDRKSLLWAAGSPPATAFGE